MADDWQSNLMDVTRAAEFLGISPLEIRRLVAEHAIPVVMVGPFVRFNRDDMKAWQRQPDGYPPQGRSKRR